MTKKRKPYKTYTKEFKLEAIRLMEDSGRPPAEVAMQPGIRVISSISGRSSWQEVVRQPSQASEAAQPKKTRVSWPP